MTHSHRRPGAFSRGRHAAPIGRRTVRSLIACGGLVAGGLTVTAIVLVNGPADAGETAAPAVRAASPGAAEPSATTAAPVVTASPEATSAASTGEAEAMTADGTCISTACESAFKKEFKAGAGDVTTETLSKYLAYAKNMCDALSEGNQAVDLRDSALEYNGFDRLSFTVTFVSATGDGSLCPAYSDQLVQLRG